MLERVQCTYLRSNPAKSFCRTLVRGRMQYTHDSHSWLKSYTGLERLMIDSFTIASTEDICCSGCDTIYITFMHGRRAHESNTYCYDRCLARTSHEFSVTFNSSLTWKCVAPVLHVTRWNLHVLVDFPVRGCSLEIWMNLCRPSFLHSFLIFILAHNYFASITLHLQSYL
jgi:hypothetical protein